MARKAGEVSIYTIAEELGVSTATVSRVINNRAGCGEETRRRVQELLRKHDFKVSHHPEQYRSRIAVVLPGEVGVNDYSARILTGIYDYISRRDLVATSVLFNAKRDGSLLKMVREQQCGAVILVNPTRLASSLPELATSSMPVMQIDEQSPLPEIGFVDHDAYSGSLQLTKHLLQLGHRKIGFLLRWCNNLNHIQRLNGYRNALREADVPADPDWVRSEEIDRNTEETAGILFHSLLHDHPDITAVIAVNDGMALGAMRAALSSGLKVPDDISIAGFDDSSFSRYLYPALTTVSHPCAEAGSYAAQAVAESLKSNGVKPLPKTILPVNLIIRESTGPVRKN